MPLKLVRYPKRSPNWYVRGTLRGVYVCESTGTDDKGFAEAERINREKRILERTIHGPGKTVTFAEAAESYLEAGGEARFLGSEHRGRWTLLIGHFGSTPIGSIGQDEADKAARHILPAGSAATRKRQVYIPLCAVLNHAEARGWGTAPKIRHPKVKEPKTAWSSPERLAKLLPHCSSELRLFIVLITYTGARLSEALRVNWDDDVNLGQRTIIIRRTKTGKMRPLHVPDPLLLELARVPLEQRRGAMFHWRQKQSVYVPLKNACKRAKVEYLPPHQQGRHTYATWLRSYAGLDLKGLMEAGGWESIQSVVRYAHVSPGEAARAADRLPSVLDPCSPQEDSVKPMKKKAK